MTRNQIKTRLWQKGFFYITRLVSDERANYSKICEISFNDNDELTHMIYFESKESAILYWKRLASRGKEFAFREIFICGYSYPYQIRERFKKKWKYASKTSTLNTVLIEKKTKSLVNDRDYKKQKKRKKQMKDNVY